MWVQKQKNGKFQMIERVTDEMTGKQKTVSVSMKRNTPQARNIAERALMEKISVMKPVRETKLTLQELLNEYLKDQAVTVKPSTYKRNYFACKAIVDMLGGYTLVDRLTAKYVRQAFRNSKKKPGTLNEFLMRFKAMMRWAYHNDYLNNVSFLDKLEPFRDRPHREKIQNKFLESGELATLLEYMKHPVWRLLTEFLTLSGLRIGEAVALTKNDVDLKARLIHVSKNYDANNKVVTAPKTSCSIRDVSIQKELLVVCNKIKDTMIRQQLQNGYEPSALFFQGIDGSYMKYYTYNKYLKENAKAAIGRPITPHTLRHTHASLLMEQGVSIDAISRRLGHENSKITRDIYLHVTEKLKERDYKEIDAIRLLR